MRAVPSRRSSCRATTRESLAHRPGARLVFDARAGDRPARRLRTRVPRQRGVSLLLPATLCRQRLQASQPVSALDGSTDAIDLGVWTKVSPARLIVPLDTHVIRLGRCLRLTRYASPGWKMAARYHGCAAGLRSAGPCALRLCAVPRRHDERVWISQAPGECAVPAARTL